jgi:hypothetical protein
VKQSPPIDGRSEAGDDLGPVEEDDVGGGGLLANGAQQRPRAAAHVDDRAEPRDVVGPDHRAGLGGGPVGHRRMERRPALRLAREVVEERLPVDDLEGRAAGADGVRQARRGRVVELPPCGDRAAQRAGHPDA